MSWVRFPGQAHVTGNVWGQELHWWHYSQKCVGLVCPPQLPYQIQQKNLIPNPSIWLQNLSHKFTLTLSGPCPVHCRMRDNGCSLHDDGKFWDCRTSGQFPNWNFVRLGSLVVKCPGCCTDVVGSIPGPDTCDRQRLGQELHWWHYSQKCAGLVCPPQLPQPD